MNTMDVFLVIRDLGYDGEYVVGIYQSKADAEYIRDHLEAIRVNEMYDQWTRYYAHAYIYFMDYRRAFGKRHDEFRIEEDEVHLA